MGNKKTIDLHKAGLETGQTITEEKLHDLIDDVLTPGELHEVNTTLGIKVCWRRVGSVYSLWTDGFTSAGLVNLPPCSAPQGFLLVSGENVTPLQYYSGVPFRLDCWVMRSPSAGGPSSMMIPVHAVFSRKGIELFAHSVPEKIENDCTIIFQTVLIAHEDGNPAPYTPQPVIPDEYLTFLEGGYHYPNPLGSSLQNMVGSFDPTDNAPSSGETSVSIFVRNDTSAPFPISSFQATVMKYKLDGTEELATLVSSGSGEWTPSRSSDGINWLSLSPQSTIPWVVGAIIRFDRTLDLEATWAANYEPGEDDVQYYKSYYTVGAGIPYPMAQKADFTQGNVPEPFASAQPGETLFPTFALFAINNPT